MTSTVDSDRYCELSVMVTRSERVLKYSFEDW